MLQRRVAVISEADVGGKTMLEASGFQIMAPERPAVTVQDHLHKRGRTGAFGPCPTTVGGVDPVRDICLVHTGGGTHFKRVLPRWVDAPPGSSSGGGAVRWRLELHPQQGAPWYSRVASSMQRALR